VGLMLLDSEEGRGCSLWRPPARVRANWQSAQAAGIASQIVVTMSSCTYLRVTCNVVAKELIERCVDDLARTGIHRHLRRSYGDERDTVERTIRKRGTMQLMQLAYGH